MSTSSFNRMLFSFLILNIVTGTVGGAMQISVPSYALTLHANTAEIGLIRGISGIGMLLLVIPAGFLADHFGPRRLFIVGSLAGAALTFALSLAGAPLALVILQGGLGLFGALKMTSLNAAFFSRIKEMGLSKAGWFRGSMSIGLTFIGPLLGGYLDRRLAAGHVFQVLAWMALIPTGLVFFFHSEAHTPQHGDTSLKENLRKQLRELGALLRRREVLFPLFTECVATGCFSAFSAFIVVITIQVLHRDVGIASLLMTLEGGTFIITVFAAGSLVTRLSNAQLYLTSASATSLSLIWLSLTHSLPGTVGASMLLGLGLGLFNLVTASRMGLIEGEKGKIVSLFAAAVGVGISLGPMAGGLIGQYFGPGAAFVAFIPFFLILTLMARRSENSRVGTPATVVQQ